VDSKLAAPAASSSLEIFIARPSLLSLTFSVCEAGHQTSLPLIAQNLTPAVDYQQPAFRIAWSLGRARALRTAVGVPEEFALRSFPPGAPLA
ncbi:MAG TPA: hypothetical protein VGA50_08850, partial [Kiloniellales bacterium]